MEIKNLNKKIFILLTLLVSLYLTYRLTGLVITFMTSLAFAYLLQPVVKLIMNKTKLSYTMSAITVFILFITILISVVSFVLPKIITQFHYLITKLPEFQISLKQKILPSISERLEQYGGVTLSNKFELIVTSLTAKLSNYLLSFSDSIWDYTLSLINIITLTLLFPVMLMFFIKDWPQVTLKFRNFIDSIGLNSVNEIWEDVDDLLTSFVKSLLTICVIMSLVYVTSFTLIGFEFSVILGILSGFGIIIPFIGNFLTSTTSITISILTNGFDVQQLWLISIYVIAQSFETSFLTPKIIGDRIGLHPNAVIMSVFITANILGPIGLFIAIPIAGTLKIIFRKFVINN